MVELFQPCRFIMKRRRVFCLGELLIILSSSADHVLPVMVIFKLEHTCSRVATYVYISEYFESIILKNVQRFTIIC